MPGLQALEVLVKVYLFLIVVLSSHVVGVQDLAGADLVIKSAYIIPHKIGILRNMESTSLHHIPLIEELIATFDKYTEEVALTSSLFVFVAFYNLSMDKLSKDQI